MNHERPVERTTAGHVRNSEFKDYRLADARVP